MNFILKNIRVMALALALLAPLATEATTPAQNAVQAAPAAKQFEGLGDALSGLWKHFIDAGVIVVDGSLQIAKPIVHEVAKWTLSTWSKNLCNMHGFLGCTGDTNAPAVVASVAVKAATVYALWRLGKGIGSTYSWVMGTDNNPGNNRRRARFNQA